MIEAKVNGEAKEGDDIRLAKDVAVLNERIKGEVIKKGTLVNIIVRIGQNEACVETLPTKDDTNDGGEQSATIKLSEHPQE